MPHAFTPSGEKDTASLSGRFHTSRVWLTGFYVVIMAMVLFTSTTFTYTQFSTRINHRFQGFVFPLVDARLNTYPTPEEVREDLFESALLADVALLILATVMSYWLAGFTLKPIQEAYERQRRFLSDASHELRTPLSILRLDLENQQHTATDPVTIDHLRSSLEETERMGRLVTDLLTLSRLDEDQGTLGRRATFSLNDLIQEATERLQPIARYHHITLACSPASEPLTVMGQREQLLQALTNIIKNAITYNQPGGTVITTLARERDRALIVVTDTGIGMSSEDLAHVFDRFYRADKSRSRRTGGSGLGMAITQSIIQHHQGTINITSERGTGTRVSIHLPIHKAS